MPQMFATPEDAEQAFYEAIESGNLEALMGVWAEDDEVVCIHPNGLRLVGQTAIRDSWRAILSSNRKIHVHLDRAVRWQGLMLATHSVVETVYMDGEAAEISVTATNVFIRGAHGWRMLVHHASPMSEGEEGNSERTPKVLH